MAMFLAIVQGYIETVQEPTEVQAIILTGLLPAVVLIRLRHHLPDVQAVAILLADLLLQEAAVVYEAAAEAPPEVAEEEEVVVVVAEAEAVNNQSKLLNSII